MTSSEQQEAQWTALAGLIYQRCNHFDPYLPAVTDDLMMAWGRVFSKHNLTPGDLSAGVDEVYGEHGSGYRPLPKDIVDAARRVRSKRIAESADLQDRQLAALAAKGDSKAACDDCPHQQHTGQPCQSCDCVAGQTALESSRGAARQRVLDIAAYAAQFGITRREARLRMQARDMSGSSYEQALAYQQRTASPPTPMPAEPVGTEEAGARK